MTKRQRDVIDNLIANRPPRGPINPPPPTSTTSATTADSSRSSSHNLWSPGGKYRNEATFSKKTWQRRLRKSEIAWFKSTGKDTWAQLTPKQLVTGDLAHFVGGKKKLRAPPHIKALLDYKMPIVRTPKPKGIGKPRKYRGALHGPKRPQTEAQKRHTANAAVAMANAREIAAPMGRGGKNQPRLTRDDMRAGWAQFYHDNGITRQGVRVPKTSRRKGVVKPRPTKVPKTNRKKGVRKVRVPKTNRKKGVINPRKPRPKSNKRQLSLLDQMITGD